MFIWYHTCETVHVKNKTKVGWGRREDLPSVRDFSNVFTLEQ